MTAETELFVRLLTRGGPSNDADRAELEAHPELAEELTALRRLAEQLEDAGEEMRDVLDEAAALPEREDDLVRRTVDDIVGTPRTLALPEARPAGESMLQRRLLAIAAALLIGVSFVWQVLETPDRPRLPVEDEPDSALELQLTYPHDEVLAWTLFRWYSRPLEGGWYRLEIHDADAPLGSEPLATVDAVTNREWRPDVALPESIRVLLEAFDEDGELLDRVERSYTLAR